MLAASKKMFEFNTNLFRVSLFFLPLCWQIRGNFQLLTKGNRCGRFALPICQFFAKNISLLQQISKFCSKDECLCAKWGWILLDLRTIYFACDIETRNLPFFCLKFHVIISCDFSCRNQFGWLVGLIGLSGKKYV